MVQLTVKILSATGRAHQLVDALHVLMRRARQQTGCSGVHIAADVDEADEFWYCEDWHDAAALERRVRSDQFSQLLALMETSPRAPSLEVRVVGETRGLEYIAAIRQGADDRLAGDDA